MIRAPDAARIDLGLSKADLARRISAKPEVVRRLLAAGEPDPTLATVVKLADALGYRLELVRTPAGQGRASASAHERGVRATG